jgi:hypothetical protein
LKSLLVGSLSPVVRPAVLRLVPKQVLADLVMAELVPPTDAPYDADGLRILQKAPPAYDGLVRS